MASLAISLRSDLIKDVKGEQTMKIFKRKKTDLPEDRDEHKPEEACIKEQIYQPYERIIGHEYAYDDYLYRFGNLSSCFGGRYRPC